MNKKNLVSLFLTKEHKEILEQVLLRPQVKSAVMAIDGRKNAGVGALTRLALTYVLKYHRKSFIAYLLQLSQQEVEK